MDTQRRSLEYRPDIDGLRAIAVISVVLYHAFPGNICGSGFVGVDIFFVISGFLISSIIYRGMERRIKGTGTARPFSFIDFYSRRVRRIFPSLIVCLAVFLVLGWFILLPDEYSLFGKHAAGASAYVSNFILWSETGSYFQVSSQTKPLLHLWSLGIEEQFYLIWPLLLFITYRLRLSVFALAAAGAMASFGFELYFVDEAPSAAFYSPLLRFWELMAGGILAWLIIYKSEPFSNLQYRTGVCLSAVLHRRLSKQDSIRLCGNMLSAVGMVLILLAVSVLDSREFPGYKALLPVMGAVLMIAAGKDAFLNRCFLSNRVMVWAGLISYPLYIWHWPFLSFAFIAGGGLPEPAVRIACIILAVIMSALTYYFVEPRLRWGCDAGAKTLGLLAVMAIIGGTGFAIMRQEGFPSRVDDPDQPLIDVSELRMEDDGRRCLESIPDWKKLSENLDITQCRFQRPSGKNTIAVIGDSHGGHLYAGLTAETGENDGVAVFPAGCAVPLIGLHAAADPWSVRVYPERKNSEYLISEAFFYILSHKNIKKVVLAHNPVCSWKNVIDTYNRRNHSFYSILKDGFDRTYSTLTKAGKEIYVVLDNPYQGTDNWLRCRSAVIQRPVEIPEFLVSGNARACSTKPEALPERETVHFWNIVSRKSALGYRNIHFIDMEQIFCRNGTCSMLDDDGHLLYRDGDHLNIRGSFHAAPFVMNELRKHQPH